MATRSNQQQQQQQEQQQHLSAIEAVKLGIRERGPYCTGLFTRSLRGRASTDANGVPFYNVNGRKWYSSCKGQFFRYWDMHQDMRGGEPSSYGLVASTEYRDSRDRLMMIVANTKPLTKTGPNGRYLSGRANAYTIVYSEEELYRLYCEFPPADRFFQEVVLPNMPHKCFMDIEKDEFGVLNPSEIDAAIEELHKGLHEMFIPKVCEFFNRVLNVPVRRQDCFIMDATRPGSKFSVHLIISTPGCHYFRTRADSWIAMVLLAKYLVEYADSNERFHSWLFFQDARNHTNMVWDFGIYGRGARNMRMLGACKADKLVVGSHWTQCRVFMPVRRAVCNQEGVHWGHFVASVNNVAQKTPIELTEDILKEAARFAMEMRSNMDMTRESFYWFQNSRNVISELRRRGMEIDSGGGAQVSRSQIGMETLDGWRAGGSATVLESDNLNRLAYEIDLMRHLDPVHTPVFSDMIDNDRMLRMRFLQTARVLLQSVCETLHPGNVVNPNVGEGRSLFSVTMSCRVLGYNTPRRLCYFGCTRGHHMVRASILVDLSVTYRCYGCNRTTTVFQTCLKPGTVPPRCVRVAHPPDFAQGFIDYDRVPPSEGEHKSYMRNIGTVNGLYLPPRGQRRTVIAMGPMGSGKTHMTQSFVDNVRREEPGAFVIAISFRKMLAKMFANKLGLRMYTDSEEYTLYEEQYLACQLESLHRLTKPQGGSNGNNTDNNDPENIHRRLMRKTFDVVIIDEIESVLAHFDSQTLETKVNSTWKILRQIVRHCRCLIVCDADIGVRTFEFLRLTRREPLPPDNELRIDNLLFHCNRRTQITTRFYDYIGESEWYQELLRRLLIGQRVFYFSNHKKHMRAIKTMLVQDLNNVKTSNIDRVDVVETIDAILRAILVIDADTTETAKMDFANCNETWVQYRLVMISPTVGAGIDFTVKNHFHVAFGYAGQFSVSPRGWNQMRGRVRFLANCECHLYIHESMDREAEQIVRETLAGENAPPGFIESDIREASEHQAERPEGDGPIADTEKPVTLHAAMHHLYRNMKIYLQDDLDFREVHEQGVQQFSVNRVTVEPSLRTILAFNLVERNRGLICFRNELIKVLQTSDPDVEYRFETRFDYESNKSHSVRVLTTISENKRKRQKTEARTMDLNKAGTDEITKLDRSGAALDQYNIDILNHRELFSIQRKNHIKHFYGLMDGIPETTWEQILRIAGGDETMTRVAELAYILGAGFEVLEEHDVRTGALQGMDIRLRDPEEATGEVRAFCRAQGSQELWPGRKSKRRRVWILLWAAGFEVADPFVNIQFPPMDILPGIGCGGGHRYLSEARLKDVSLQAWLKDNITAINDALCAGGLRKRDIPKEGEMYDYKKVRQIVKRCLEHTMGLEMLTFPRRRAKKRKRNEFEANEEDDASETATDAMSVSTSATAKTESSIFDLCPPVRESPWKPLLRCTTENHTDEDCKCKELFHIEEKSMALMLSLVWLFVHSKANDSERDAPLIAKVRDEVDRMVRLWGRKPILADFARHANPWQQQQEQQEQQQEEEEDEQEMPQEETGYGAYSGYGYDGNEDEDEGEEEGEQQQVAGYDEYVADAMRDMRIDDADSAGGRFSQGSACDVAESAMSTVTTLDERSLKRKIALACKERPEEEKYLEIQQRLEVVDRYLGPNPYAKNGRAFVSMLMTPAYEGRRARMLSRFQEEMQERNAKNLEKALRQLGQLY